jgi:hypothetical protein
MLGDKYSRLCIPSTLAFFENHPERIFDVDYQVLFEMNVYERMNDALKLDGLNDKLIQFIERNVEKRALRSFAW